jgi:hypothetical protein
VLLSTSAIAHAQDGGPVVIGAERPQFKPFELEHLDAALDFYNQLRSDRLKQQGQPTLSEKEALFRQTVDMDMRAYIGHKNLIDFGGTLKIGLEEDSLSSDNADGTRQKTSYISTTDLYDLRALILGNGPVPTTVYARRDENIYHQDFGGSVKNTVTEEGAIADFRSTIAPTSVQYFHREQDQNDQLGRGSSFIIEDSAIVHSDLHLTESQRMLVDYTFDHVDEGGTTAFHDTYDRHDANVTHWLTFGPLDHNTLRSSLHVDDQTGAFAERTINLNEELTLEHSKQLETRYNLTLEDLERQSQEQRVARGSALIRHRLFDSLTSTASVGGGALDVPGEFHSTDIFGTLGTDYTKKVPFGRVNADAAISVNRQDNSERGETVPISNSTFVFMDPFPVTINRRNIVPSSVVVRDITHLHVYIQGLDYTLEVFPDRAELHRIVGGNIANGQAVSVDYDIGPEPANTIDTTTGTLALRYDISEGILSGLSFYASYRQLDQSVNAVDPSLFVLDNFRDYRYGTEYRIGGATFIAERQNHDSTVEPFDSFRFEVRYDRRFSRTSLLTLTSSWDDVDYRFTNSHMDLYLATARWTTHLAENLEVSLHTQGRVEDHNDSPDLHGLEGGVDITWHKGQTSIYGSVFGSMLDSGPSSRFSETVTFGLRRAF